MGRNKQDNFKRSIGQAVNHASGAILDINSVYEAFAEHDRPEGEELKRIMLIIDASRNELLRFAEKAWLLDEDALMRYL